MSLTLLYLLLNNLPISLWKQLLIKKITRKKQNILLSILHRLRITQIYVADFILLKISKCSSYQLQLEADYILLHPKLKRKFYTRWNPKWLKKYMPNCLPYLTVKLYLSFLFHNNNSVTINKFKKWIIIPACFKNRKIWYSTLALNFTDWPYGVIVTRHFRPKSGNLNDRVYCKQTDGTLNMLFIVGSSSFLRPTIPELRKLLVFGQKNKYTMI